MDIKALMAAKSAAAEGASAPSASASGMCYFASDAPGLSFRLGYPASVHYAFDNQKTMKTENAEAIEFLKTDFCSRGLAREISEAEYRELNTNHDISAFSADQVKELLAAAEALKAGKL